MKSIYRNEEGKNKILELYDSQLNRLSVPWKDIYVETSFGRTHLVETGNISGEPLLVFHGGDATTAYNLLSVSCMPVAANSPRIDDCRIARG